jgi:hypothetical protein
LNQTQIGSMRMMIASSVVWLPPTNSPIGTLRGDHAVERGRYGDVAEIDLRVLSVGGVDMVSMKNVLRLK